MGKQKKSYSRRYLYLSGTSILSKLYKRHIDIFPMVPFIGIFNKTFTVTINSRRQREASTWVAQAILNLADLRKYSGKYLDEELPGGYGAQQIQPYRLAQRSPCFWGLQCNIRNGNSLPSSREGGIISTSVNTSLIWPWRWRMDFPFRCNTGNMAREGESHEIKTCQCADLQDVLKKLRHSCIYWLPHSYMKTQCSAVVAVICLG